MFMQRTIHVAGKDELPQLAFLPGIGHRVDLWHGNVGPSLLGLRSLPSAPLIANMALTELFDDIRAKRFGDSLGDHPVNLFVTEQQVFEIEHLSMPWIFFFTNYQLLVILA